MYFGICSSCINPDTSRSACSHDQEHISLQGLKRLTYHFYLNLHNLNYLQSLMVVSFHLD